MPDHKPNALSAILFGGQPLPQGGTITPDYAGRLIEFAGRDGGEYLTVLLYAKSEGDRPQDAVRIEPVDKRYYLPPHLPPDEYRISARPKSAADNDAKHFKFVVAAKVEPVDPATGSISGVLFNDDDGDGIRDEGEAATGVRTVTLGGIGSTAMKTAQSKPDGSYTFTGLAAGVYHVGRVFTGDWKLSNNDKGYVVVTVAPGQQVTGINLGSVAKKKVTDSQPQPTVPGNDQQAPKLTGKMRLGLCDGSRYTPDLLRPFFSAVPFASVGPWIGTNDFGPYKRDGDVDNAIAFAAEYGLTILWRCAQGEKHDKPGTQAMTRAKAKAGAVAWHLAHAKDVLAALDANPKTRGSKGRIQVGNEPDNGQEYYTDGIDSYVDDYLAPVAKALNAEFPGRVEVIAAGFSWNAPELERVADRIAAAGVHAIAMHGYPLSGSKKDMAAVAAAVTTAHSRNMLLIISEGNTKDGQLARKLRKEGKITEADAVLAAWPDKIGPYLLACERLGVDELLYFIAYDAGTAASPARLFDVEKQGDKVVAIKPTKFFDAVKAVLSA